MNNNINLDTKIEYKGYWYLPSKPEYKVAGIVTYYPNDKIILELLGSFDKEIESLLSCNGVSVIFGNNSEAKEISLIHCVSAVSVNFSADFPLVRYTCRYMIVGKHIQNLGEKSEYRVSIKIPELSYWCFPGAIDSSLVFSKENKRVEQICIKFNSSNNRDINTLHSVAIDDNYSILLKRGIIYDSSAYNLKPMLEQFTYLEFLSQKNASLSEFLTLIHSYEDFLSLATLSTIKSSEIIFYDNNLYQQCREQKNYRPIYFIRAYFERKNVTNVDKHNYLFDYRSIKDIYDNILKKWFNAPSELNPIRNHLIDSLKKKNVFGSVDFLIIIQAVEGFWWRFREASFKLTNNISKREKTSLKTILTELLNEFKDIELVSKLEMNVDAVVDSRHYYSHFILKSQKPNTLDGIELFKESKKLRILLICCVLSFIGLNNSQINIIFQKTNLELL